MEMHAENEWKWMRRYFLYVSPVLHRNGTIFKFEESPCEMQITVNVWFDLEFGLPNVRKRLLPFFAWPSMPFRILKHFGRRLLQIGCYSKHFQHSFSTHRVVWFNDLNNDWTNNIFCVWLWHCAFYSISQKENKGIGREEKNADNELSLPHLLCWAMVYI